MKKDIKHIDEEVEKTLQAFDGVEKAKPRPFLYTRIQARLERKAERKARAGVLSPAFQRFAIIVVMLIVAFNIYTAARVFIYPDATDTSLTNEQLFVEEYYPSTPTLYNISQTTTNP
jgi:hypothetical protein